MMENWIYKTIVSYWFSYMDIINNQKILIEELYKDLEELTNEHQLLKDKLIELITKPREAGR